MTEDTTNPLEGYLEYLEPSEEVPAMKLLNDLVEEQLRTELEVAKLNEELNEANERLKELTETKIPDLMDILGTEEMKLISGLTVEISEKIRASIPKAREADTFKWMRDHEFGGLIRHNVIFDFSVGEDEISQKFLKHVAEEWSDLECAEKTVVHPSTLTAFAKKRLEEGEELPLELFSIFRQRVATVKTSTQKKGKKGKK